jgi:hypothetical protein
VQWNNYPEGVNLENAYNYWVDVQVNQKAQLLQDLDNLTSQDLS